MHLDNERIERVLHEELDLGEDAEVRNHLRDCVLCERRLRDAARDEDQIMALLGNLDHPVPAVDVASVVRLASGRRWRWERVAASIALVLVSTGLLYAVPGSPIPGLLRGVSGWLSPDDRAEPDLESSPAAVPHVSGVALVPGPDLAIVFTSPQPRGAATVRLVDTPELEVRSFGEPVPFDVGMDRVTIANNGTTADYEILLPRGVPSVRIQVGSATVLRKEGDRISTGVLPDSTGSYTIPIQTDEGR